MGKSNIFCSKKGRVVLLFALAFITLSSGLYAQTGFPGETYWSFDMGAGMTDILVEGLSYQFVLDPKIMISPPLMIGNRLGINYSTDEILSLENQIYLRWNFFRSENPKKQVKLFVQSGIGLLASYRREENGLFNDPTRTRGSFMLDAAAGITIPLTSTWHIEPAVRAGYPHIAGFSITMGCKIPMGRNEYPSTYVFIADKEKYKADINGDTWNLNELVLNGIANVEFIMFGADIGEYNVDIDRETRRLNDLVLNEIAQILIKNPDYRVRIEGHANPIISQPSKLNNLMPLSKTRADVIAGQLKARGVKERQMIVIAFGGTRPVTLEQNYCNRNRRVELIVFKDTIKKMGSK